MGGNQKEERTRDLTKMRGEAVQVGAMITKLIVTIDDEQNEG